MSVQAQPFTFGKAVNATIPSPLLVTGAPGWLCDVLLTRVGKQSPLTEIRCLVQKSLNAERLASWRKAHPEVGATHAGDLADAESLKAACEKLAGGAVLHAAAIIHPRRTRDWYTINRDGTIALAQAAKAAGAKRFLYVSSNAAQGASDSPAKLLTEDMPCNPLSHYGRSKFQAEQALLKMHEPGKFEISIVRPCMFYGPPVPERHVDIFKRIQRGRLPLVGSGNYARSLSYIDDLVAGTILALWHPQAAGEIFNLCDARAYTTKEVCEAMASALGVSPKFLRLPAFSASVAYQIDCAIAACGLYSMSFHLLGEANWNVGCSSQKARERLGWQPQVDLFEGYKRAVAWCRERKLIN
ncbi:MAG TPA: NAD(P)-dependent oxidoreductase [Planctomycetota bacterium]|nr:NAD(P)-dependent oxidoreductase [Planctomycetota bacterium]